MPTIRAFRSCSLLLATAWLGCARDEPGPSEPSPSQAAATTISGRLIAADGRNICRTLGDASISVSLLNPGFDGFNDPFLGRQLLTCPENAFSLPASAGTADLLVELPLDPALGSLPWHNLYQVAVSEAGANQNLRLVEGTALGGRATLDGNPFEGVPLDLLYDFNPNYEATFASSGPDGRWVEFIGRTPVILQNDTRYLAAGCDAILGARQVAGFPVDGFLFPTGLRRLSCTLETSPATQFSHTGTRLALTPMPGDIGGGFSSELFPQFGIGWGVQFPVAPGTSPTHGTLDFSELFTGGLLIGLPPQRGNPARVMIGADPGGAIGCGTPCRDFGLDGSVTFSPTGATGERKRVTWRYPAARPSDGVRLDVTQLSIDGKAPNDYVLFRFTFRNAAPAAVTFYAGFFGDWDIQFNAADDQGFTALAGRLMYQASSPDGIHAGTMFLGDAPISGTYFFGSGEIPTASDQIEILSGALRRRTAGPGDLRYIHGVGPITLRSQESQDVWMVVVAGENETQLLENAAAARADVAGRLGEPLAAAGETRTIVPADAGVSRGSRTLCQKCWPKP